MVPWVPAKRRTIIVAAVGALWQPCCAAHSAALRLLRRGRHVCVPGDRDGDVGAYCCWPQTLTTALRAPPPWRSTTHAIDPHPLAGWLTRRQREGERQTTQREREREIMSSRASERTEHISPIREAAIRGNSMNRLLANGDRARHTHTHTHAPLVVYSPGTLGFSVTTPRARGMASVCLCFQQPISSSRGHGACPSQSLRNGTFSPSRRGGVEWRVWFGFFFLFFSHSRRFPEIPIRHQRAPWLGVLAGNWFGAVLWVRNRTFHGTARVRCVEERVGF